VGEWLPSFTCEEDFLCIGDLFLLVQIFLMQKYLSKESFNAKILSFCLFVGESPC
jgi:hypothetical protein